MKPKLSELLSASFEFEDYSPLHTKILLLNAMLFITAALSLLFTLIHLFITHSYELLLIDFCVFLSLSYTLYILRKKNDHQRAAYIGNAVLFTAILAITLLQHGENYTLIWTFFFAPFSIVTLGASRGLIVSFIFMVMVLAVTYVGVGEWQEGAWNIQSYLRFLIAHFLMLYVIFVIQNSNERTNDKIDRMRRYEKKQLKFFEQLSITDPLTSLYNRRFLKEIFPRQLHSAKRNDKLFAFFILDLDYFKQYNDTYGHQKGDWAIEQTANILKEHLRRSSDYTFRLGGEEFAAIIIGDDTDSINNRISTILQAVADQKIEHKSSNVKSVLTCSIGACILEDDSEYDLEDFYSLADEALYRAKDNGRNQVIYAHQNI